MGVEYLRGIMTEVMQAKHSFNDVLDSYNQIDMTQLSREGTEKYLSGVANETVHTCMRIRSLWTCNAKTSGVCMCSVQEWELTINNFFDTTSANKDYVKDYWSNNIILTVR